MAVYLPLLSYLDGFSRLEQFLSCCQVLYSRMSHRIAVFVWANVVWQCDDLVLAAVSKL